MRAKSRAKKNRQRVVESPVSQKPGRRWRPVVFFMAALFGATIGFAFRVGLDRDLLPGRSVIPASLMELPEMMGATSETTDIALMNLLCAKDLPGAEDLDIEWTLSELDRWAAHVKFETDRHLYQFHRNPGEYEDSEAYFRMLMLVTVLQQDLGVRYNPDRIHDPDFTNSQDLFIQGMVTPNLSNANGGTCVSMPVLYVAIGRRLGHPLKLALTKPHVFARWDAPDHPNPSLRGRFNVEASGPGLSTPADERYMQPPFWLTDADLKSGWYLRSLTPPEELAVFLMQRWHCLEDTGQIEAAREVYGMAHRLAPRSDAMAHLVQASHGTAAKRGIDASTSTANDRSERDQWLRDQRRLAADRAEQIIHRQEQRTRSRGRHPPPDLFPVDSPVVPPHQPRPRFPSTDD